MGSAYFVTAVLCCFDSSVCILLSLDPLRARTELNADVTDACFCVHNESHFVGGGHSDLKTRC